MHSNGVFDLKTDTNDSIDSRRRVGAQCQLNVANTATLNASNGLTLTQFNISTTLQLLLNMSYVKPTISLFITRAHTHSSVSSTVEESNNLQITLITCGSLWLSTAVCARFHSSYLKSNYAFYKIWHTFCNHFF